MSTATARPFATAPVWTDQVRAWWQLGLRYLRRDWVIVLLLVVATGLVHGIHMTVTPALVTTDDEGTYVAQAWAIINTGELAHYTYWYDHPPLGWIQLAGWARLTLAFDRYDFAISVGREFMLVVKLASVAFMYLLCRRLGMNKFFASFGVALFALSPLAVYFQRLTFLDNITIPWLLAAFFFAASPRNRLGAYAVSAICFAVACLTKETSAILLPAILWQVWHGSHPRTRWMSLAIWVPVMTLVGMFYVLLAVIKNELLPGPGHVDLMYAITWQLANRASSGSVFDPTSASSVIARSWAALDPWLIGLGIALVLPAMLSRELRAVALALGIQIAMMLRPGGYLPQPYVIAMIPFAALVVAGSLGALWSSGTLNRFRRLRRQIPGLPFSYAQAPVQALALAAVVVFVSAIGIGQWSPRLASLMTDDRNVSVAQATQWIKTNVPVRKGANGEPVRILVSDAMWVDLKELGYEPEWYFKVDLDPAVKSKFPNGWQDVDYAVYTNEMNEIAKSDSKSDMTTTLDARTNGTLVAEFGSLSEKIWIYQVPHPGSS